MPGYHIRLHCPSDLARIREITIEGFDGVSIDRAAEEKLGKHGPVGWEDCKWRAIEGDLSLQPDGIFVAEVAEQVAGYVRVIDATQRNGQFNKRLCRRVFFSKGTRYVGANSSLYNLTTTLF